MKHNTEVIEKQLRGMDICPADTELVRDFFRYAMERDEAADLRDNNDTKE